jgi:hypothetical protein
LLKGSVFDTMVAFPFNGQLYMRCRLNVFNCCLEKGAGFLAIEPLSSNERSIIRLLGATPQYEYMDYACICQFELRCICMILYVIQLPVIRTVA